MIEFNPAIAVMNDEDLLACTRELARKSCVVEAELLLHLGEIEARRLHSQRAFPSMIAFCMTELGFSEGAAYNRIFVARAARRLPAILEAVRSGRVHVTALRLLAPHLTEENHREVIARAAGRTREQVAELVVSLAPRPVPATEIRKLPAPRSQALPLETQPHAAHGTPRTPPVVPIAEETFKLQLAI